jgi:hypothetical protein
LQGCTRARAMAFPRRDHGQRYGTAGCPTWRFRRANVLRTCIVSNSYAIKRLVVRSP